MCKLQMMQKFIYRCIIHINPSSFCIWILENTLNIWQLPFNSNITSSCDFNVVSFIGGVFVTLTALALSSNLSFKRSNIQSYARTYKMQSKWWQLVHCQWSCFGNQMVQRGFLHVCDKQRLHDTILSICASVRSDMVTLNGRWQIEHKSSKFFWSNSLCCRSLDADAVDDAIATSDSISVVAAGFIQSADILSVVSLLLSVIFLLRKKKWNKREKQAYFNHFYQHTNKITFDLNFTNSFVKKRNFFFTMN